MLAVKGTIKNGVIEPEQPLKFSDGQQVIITVLQEDIIDDETYQAEAKAFMELLKKCTIDAGIDDLAHQHDHYLYGLPKQD
jgi:predicted DNA-binding antitoxin AbrB/MazE fold protein